jgi:hypothetical protein
MKTSIFASLLCLATASADAAPLAPFAAECTEGETHRYDGTNGMTIAGEQIQDRAHGWSTERWGGGLKVDWDGGRSVRLGKITATVTRAEDGYLAAQAETTGSGSTNIYSFIIDTQIGEALITQVQAVQLGESRSIKGRTQSLICIFEPLG